MTILNEYITSLVISKIDNGDLDKTLVNACSIIPNQAVNVPEKTVVHEKTQTLPTNVSSVSTQCFPVMKSNKKLQVCLAVNNIKCGRKHYDDEIEEPKEYRDIGVATDVIRVNNQAVQCLLPTNEKENYKTEKTAMETKRKPLMVVRDINNAEMTYPKSIIKKVTTMLSFVSKFIFLYHPKYL